MRLQKKSAQPPRKRVPMDSNIIVAGISLIGTLIGSASGVLVSGKLTNFRIKQLEDKVAKHNNFAERLPVVEEHIKGMDKRISELESEVKKREN